MTESDEAGFTLAEVLIATVILAIIFGVVTEAMIVGLRTTDTTNQRLNESIDTQQVSLYFGRDAQSADVVNPTGTTCGSVAGTSVVAFSWTDGGTAKVSTYVLGGSSTNGERLLTRSYCEGGVVLSQIGVARNIGSDTPTAAVSVTCDAAECGASAKPRVVTLSLRDGSGYTYSLNGVRRETT